MKCTVVSALCRLHDGSLHLYPEAFRAEFGEEMTAVFAEAVMAAAEEGPGAVAAICWQEIADYPTSLSEAYRQVVLFEGVVALKRETSWRIWPGWVALNLLSIPLAMVIAMALVVLASRLSGAPLPFSGTAAVNLLQAFLYISALIMVTAVLQWALLRRYLVYAGFWIPLTILGWSAGILFIYLAWLMTGDEPGVWLPALIPPFLGVAVGLAQWTYLRRVVDHAGYWVLASAAGYGVLARGMLGPFTSILEFLLFLSLPFLITGLVLMLLLRQADSSLAFTAGLKAGRTAVSWQRLVRGLAIILLLVALFFAGMWVYAAGQLTLAKAQGTYPTAAEGMQQRILRASGRYPVDRITDVRAGPNQHDGSQPHVWFVVANVWAERRPDGKLTGPRGHYSAGSYFLRVNEGWVHVPEGAFPDFIGWIMALYGLEGAGAAS